MFWLYDNTNKFNFLQIFHHYTKFKDSGAGCLNFVYDFTTEQVLTQKEIKEYNLESIETQKINYTIKIKDSYIQYENDTSIITFQIENEFIKETDELNTLKLPFFKWKYTKVDNHKLPNISSKNYDFYYPSVSFLIYKINENKLFIIETKNDISKKYILEKNVD
jgi:hypothetical protein